MSSADKHEPPPLVNDSRPVYEIVIEDMQKRAEMGRAKYGTYLQAYNGRDALWDAYQEILDAALYIRAAIIEGERDEPR
jgi:hypothetical protein